MESELQPAWLCSLLLLKVCFIIFFLEFEARQPQTHNCSTYIPL